MSLNSAIKARLTALAGLRQQIGTRAYAVVMPKGTTLPGVTWAVVTDVPIHAMGSDAGYRNTLVRVNSFAKSHAKSVAVDEQVRLALTRFRGTAGGTVVQDILEEGTTDLYFPETEEGVYHRARDFRIFYE